MANGYTGVILRVDLTSRAVERLELPEEFYRTYMGGGAVGAYFLLRDTAAGTGPLEALNVLTFAPSVVTGSATPGLSRCSAVALSPLTNAVGEGQAGGDLGPAIKMAGFDAVVVSGKASGPCYLLIDDDRVEVCGASHLWGCSVSEVYEALHSEYDSPGTRVSIAQCGPAGERLVRFASIMVDRNHAVGRTGLGAVMGSKLLRAVVIRSDRKKRVQFADPEGLKKLSALAGERLDTADFPATLRKHGTPGIVGFQSKAGNMATRNYTLGCHEAYENLTGQVFDEKIGAGQTTCYGCPIACRKRVRAEAPYRVTDKLGGPEFETLSTLGSNLDIANAAAVAHANELCNENGIDTITMGALMSYVCEATERGYIAPEKTGGKTLRFGCPEDLFWLIERVAARDGVGGVLAEGFDACIRHFGVDTAAFAVHCKGQGLPAHMAQVKPSQAIMYAACPLGGDHMSSEHDWLLAGGGELYRALGIIGTGNARSTGLPKVRMTAYSQYYYSLLDTLAMCMFVWGPGNLFTYRETEDAVRYATGWESSLWELMKVGERKTNMMRQVNARRGFTRKHDVLPARVFEPLTGGPSKDARVEESTFTAMLDQYYGVMGWDLETGNPSQGKLMELGLEWTL